MANICPNCNDPKSGCGCFNYDLLKEDKGQGQAPQQAPRQEATTAIAAPLQATTTAIAAPLWCSNCNERDKTLTKCENNNCGFWFCCDTKSNCKEKHFHTRYH